MAAAEGKGRLNFVQRLGVALGCAIPLGLTIVAATFALGAEDHLSDMLSSAGPGPLWLHSLESLSLSVAGTVALIATTIVGLSLTVWVGDRLADRLRGASGQPPATAPDAVLQEDEDHKEDEAEEDSETAPWLLSLVGGLGFLLLCWGLLGLVDLPWQVADERRAQMLAAHGTRVEVSALRVEVDDPWWVDPLYADPEVRHVEVMLPGASVSGWVNLTGILSPLLDEDEVGTGFQFGWQPGNDTLWYSPPLEVLYRVDDAGDVHAMAAEDVTDWINTGVEVEPVLPLVGLLLVIVSWIPRAVALLRARSPRSAVGRHRA